MKHLDNQIIDYISGEMDHIDRIAFEQLMDSDPAIKVQVEEMQSAQSVLGNWDDASIEIPGFEIPEIHNNASPTKVVQLRTFSPWMKYAASAAAVIGLLWMSGLQVNTAGNSMTLSFGAPQQQLGVDEKIDLAVTRALEKYTANQSIHLTQLSNQIGTEIAEVKSSVMNVSNNWDNQKAAVQNMMNNISDKQYDKLQAAFLKNKYDQTLQIDETLADLIEYIDDKRLDDLNQIQGAFTQLVTAMDAQQQRTDELFQGLIQPVQASVNY